MGIAAARRRAAARAASDHVIDLGPGAGEAGGTPAEVAEGGVGASAKYLSVALEESAAPRRSA
ncbi:hypothetical protein [Streptomyces bauhiniae]|uniref:hypothetical protein n=1 Tax=Streptomyces bauhiniae TaxID=2340725 RepID=UPI00365A0412